MPRGPNETCSNNRVPVVLAESQYLLDKLGVFIPGEAHAVKLTAKSLGSLLRCDRSFKKRNTWLSPKPCSRSSGAVTASPQTGEHQYVAAPSAVLFTFAVFAVGVQCLRLLTVLGVSFASGVVLLASVVVLLQTHKS